MRVNMAAASCSRAVASRRAKYEGDFRVSTLLGAQPLGRLVPSSYSICTYTFA